MEHIMNIFDGLVKTPTENSSEGRESARLSAKYAAYRYPGLERVPRLS
jgi:hypothetical protein